MKESKTRVLFTERRPVHSKGEFSFVEKIVKEPKPFFRKKEFSFP